METPTNKKSKEQAFNYKFKWLPLLLSIGVVIGFMTIKISYNGSPNFSIYKNIWAILKEFNPKDLLSFSRNGFVNLVWVSLFVLLISGGLVSSSFINRMKLALIIIILFILLWIFIIISYRSFIESSLYLRSSVFFLAFNIIYIIYIIRSPATASL